MRSCLFIVLLFFINTLIAQELHAWVYFKDKQGVAAALQDPTRILTQRSIDRKQRYDIVIDDRDIPVNQDYVAALKLQPGINYKTQSKWFNCAHIVGTMEAIQQLENLEYVDRVVYASRSRATPSTIEVNYQEPLITPLNDNASQNQVDMIGLDVLHDSGYKGSNIWIAVTDSGFPFVNVNLGFETSRLENRILGGYDFVDGDGSYFEDDVHGARVLSIMAGQLEQGDRNYEGTAPKASYLLYRTEDATSETPVEMSYWVAAAERADSLGVDVMNVSLGYLDFDNPMESLSYSNMNGTSFISQGASIAANKGMLIVTSAGNSGNSSTHPYIVAPADAPNVFTVGAVNNAGEYAAFSSRGPSKDGRLKPNVSAQGQQTLLIKEDGTIGAGSGTSYSSPIIAGAMACLMQAFPNQSPVQLMQLVQQSSSLASDPDNFYGYGIPNFAQVFQTLSQSQARASMPFTYYVKDKILFIGMQEESVTSIQLFNLQGQLVINQSIEKLTQIDLSHLSSGIYFFKINQSMQAHKIAL